MERNRQPHNSYFTRGHYDVRKSEERREEIRRQHTPKRFTPLGVNTQEYIHQRNVRQAEALVRLITTAFTHTK